jgi:hypothetical protein
MKSQQNLIKIKNMSSSVRVYNLFNQINNFLQKGEIVTGIDMLKNIFGLESDEDLNPIIPPFIKYIQNNIFNTFTC